MRRRNAALEGPDPIDIHVGQQIRFYRTLRGISQERLAQGLGVSFQQVQKYERGTNRISASMLFRSAQVLGVAVAKFFDGLGDPGEKSAHVERFAHELLADLDRLPENAREGIRSLIRSLAVVPESAEEATARKTG